MKLKELLVDYRFGDLHDVREFLSESYHLRSVAKDFRNLSDVINYNYENIRYPLNVFGQPAPEARFSYSKPWFFSYSFNRERSYVWLYPEETVLTRRGICIDTANLVAAALLSAPSPLRGARVVLGRVESAETGELLGYHAWVEVPGLWVETTIHRGQGSLDDVVFPARDPVVNVHGSLKYVAMYKYDREGVEEVGGEKEVKLLVFGPTTGDKKSVRIWRASEKRKQRLIWSQTRG